MGAAKHDPGLSAPTRRTGEMAEGRGVSDAKMESRGDRTCPA